MASVTRSAAAFLSTAPLRNASTIRRPRATSSIRRLLYCCAARSESSTISVPTPSAAPSTVPPPFAMAPDTRALLADRVQSTLVQLYGDDAPADPKLTPATRPDFGDYQCNAALALSKGLSKKATDGKKVNSRQVADAIVDALDLSDLCETPTIAGPGFINLTLKDSFVVDRLKAIHADRKRLGIPPRETKQRIVVDFSSPNIAKDMHVGHLRSTIIGDTLARILEFLGHDTLRINHTGDWGTQFGQLIAYLKLECPEILAGEGDAAAEIGDLVVFYKRAKAKFDEDADFKQTALAEVVKLQGGDPDSLKAWNMICDVSRAEFEKIYSRLDIKLTERGESFYNPFLKDIVERLKNENFAVKNEGAMVVFLEGKRFIGKDKKPLPVIVQKSDGGFLYATTDLAAVQYRVNEDKADRIIYVTDVGQSLHFEQIFAVSTKAGLLPESVKAEHVAFGLVQGADGKKFKTRSGAAPKLAELLDEARDRVRTEIVRREETDAATAAENGQEAPEKRSDEELERISEIIGIAAVKYADLKNNRKNNYKFSFDKMVKLEGDTAPYIMYAYARVQGIYRTAAAAAANGNGVEGNGVEKAVEFKFVKKEERALAKNLMRLVEILGELEKDLLPNVLCEYVFGLTGKFNQFYEQCPVLNAETEELKASRLALCQISADTMQLCLGLLGIPTLDRI